MTRWVGKEGNFVASNDPKRTYIKCDDCGRAFRPHSMYKKLRYSHLNPPREANVCVDCINNPEAKHHGDNF
jgi:hypothetical protein|tara:strand:+ start:201 stop:413 length:213 start_codon:yes stop_codon:yes gene_type:complete